MTQRRKVVKWSCTYCTVSKRVQVRYMRYCVAFLVFVVASVWICCNDEVCTVNDSNLLMVTILRDSGSPNLCALNALLYGWIWEKTLPYGPKQLTLTLVFPSIAYWPTREQPEPCRSLGVHLAQKCELQNLSNWPSAPRSSGSWKPPSLLWSVLNVVSSRLRHSLVSDVLECRGVLSEWKFGLEFRIVLWWLGPGIWGFFL